MRLLPIVLKVAGGLLLSYSLICLLVFANAARKGKPPPPRGSEKPAWQSPEVGSLPVLFAVFSAGLLTLLRGFGLDGERAFTLSLWIGFGAAFAAAFVLEELWSANLAQGALSDELAATRKELEKSHSEVRRLEFSLGALTQKPPERPDRNEEDDGDPRDEDEENSGLRLLDDLMTLAARDPGAGVTELDARLVAWGAFHAGDELDPTEDDRALAAVARETAFAMALRWRDAGCAVVDDPIAALLKPEMGPAERAAYEKSLAGVRELARKEMLAVCSAADAARGLG